MAVLPDAPLAGLVLGAFALGIASGVHCVGMCGGLVAAFSSQRSIVRVVRDAHDLKPRAALLAFFNAGRIGAYTLAGALAGAAGSAGAFAASAFGWQTLLFVLANLMLVLVGLHLAGLSAALAKLEGAGAPVWRRIQPLAAGFLPADTPWRAFVAGSLWGWLPCGLVYGMLVTALASGSIATGAAAMFAFGLGTLPTLMLAGLALSGVQRLARLPALRRIAGGIVLGFGLVGLARAAEIGEIVRRAASCVDFGWP